MSCSRARASGENAFQALLFLAARGRFEVVYNRAYHVRDAFAGWREGGRGGKPNASVPQIAATALESTLRRHCHCQSIAAD